MSLHGASRGSAGAAYTKMSVMSIRNSSHVRVMFEQKLHRPGWIAGEHAGFDPDSTTTRCTLFGSRVHLVPRKVGEMANSGGDCA